ncbi:MAG TPA: PIN domain-containing protein [Candidatus Nanoarchaeia archaeon]|nr:PIN domain-containing protein [Candidatus Nanoarchaeia archaeon]
MQQALLDTNFIITCIKQKIDLFEELQFRGISIIIPKQVIEELKKLSSKKGEAADVSEFALKYLKTGNFEEVNLPINHFHNKVDEAIMDYAEKNPSLIIATLDKRIRMHLDNPHIVIRGRKKLDIL